MRLIDTIDEWFEKVAADGRTVPLVALAFLAWCLLGLTSSPGFSLDEAAIYDASRHLSEYGYLAVPSLGPGFGHESAYFYQTPLHELAIGLVFEIFGEGLYQARLLSSLLASICLILVGALMRRLSPTVAIVAVLVLAVDPTFAARARETRYDWLAMDFALLSFLVLVRFGIDGRGGRRAGILSAVIAGLCAGAGANAHVLGLVFVPGLVAVMFLFQRSDSALLATRVIAFIASVGLALVPFTVYAFSHWRAFMDQFVYQVVAHTQSEEGTWIVLEMRKFLVYFWTTPFLLVLLLLSAVLVLAGAWRRVPEMEDPGVRAIVLMAVSGTILISIVSGHKPWHQLLASPFLSALPGVALVLSPRGSVRRRVLIFLLSLAVASGLAVTWGVRTYQAIRLGDSRDMTQLEERLAALIPPGSSVYGDYRLILLSSRLRWRFVQHHYVLRRDEERLRRIPFEFVVVSSMTADAGRRLDLSRYSTVGVVRSASDAKRGPVFNTAARPIELTVLRRRPVR
ncbi:MAG: hypothetical protein DIJKHBIC_00914 [Thermoanaerobaculia bacterium]|nr:hypothetical protein [Thermoanaerobaculia bacterium]